MWSQASVGNDKCSPAGGSRKTLEMRNLRSAVLWDFHGNSCSNHHNWMHDRNDLSELAKEEGHSLGTVEHLTGAKRTWLTGLDAELLLMYLFA